MYKIFHQLLSNFVLTTPSVHYIKPKALNLYFKKALSSNYKLLMLGDYRVISIHTDTVKDSDDNNIFRLSLLLEEFDNESILHVADFETRQDLEDAVIVLRNKLYAPEESLLKNFMIGTLSLFAIIVVLTIAQGIYVASSKKNTVATSDINNSQLLQELQRKNIENQEISQLRQVDPQAQAQAEADLQKAREQVGKVIADGTKPKIPDVAAQQDNSNQVQEQRDPITKDFMDKLKK